MTRTAMIKRNGILTGKREQKARVNQRMRADLPKIHSQELLNKLFRHPYRRIACVQKDHDLNAQQTAAKYLDQLAEAGFVEKQQAGRNNYYVNVALVRLFVDEAGGR
jgi:Fic family protein